VEDKISKEKIALWIYIAPTAIVVILWALSWYLIVSNNSLKGWDQRGTFGDMFGAVNALFSGLAFVGIIITIYLQSKELTLQRRELEFTRDELRGQKEQLEIQNKTLILQKFENTFFQLLGFHNDIVKAIDVRPVSGGQHSTGRTAFQILYRDLQGEYNNHPARLSLTSEKLIKLAYASFFKIKQPYIGHYFRSLYNIVKFVDKSTLSEDDKKIYTNLLRAQLSSNELLLLFYNCLSDVGAKFYDGVEKFNLLKTTPTNELLDPTHIDLYKKTKFEL